MADRLESLERMAAERPDEPRFRFGLALEYEKRDRYEDAVRELRAYLDLTDDEGNAWGRLGSVLRALGREEEARDAYRRGVEVSLRHGHPSMAEEFEAVLDDWE